MRPVQTPAQLRRFGFTMAAALGAIGAFLLWKDAPAAPVLLGVAVLFALTGAAVPRLLHPVERLWMALGEKLSIVSTFVILTAAFYLLITPIALLLRLLGKDLLRQKPAPPGQSYWRPVEPDGPASRPDKPF